MSYAIAHKPRSNKVRQKNRDHTDIALQGVQTTQIPFSPISQISHLQRTIGNQAVQRLFKSEAFQRKPNIGKPNEKYEGEAVGVEDILMRMPEPFCPTCKGEENIREKHEGKEEPIKTKLFSKEDQSTQIVNFPIPFTSLGRNSSQQSLVRFRLPAFSELKSIYKSATLKIPESVIKDRITMVLIRMEKEKRLKSTDPVATIVSKIFPGGGVIDESEFNKVVDVKDRNLIYKTVLDANSKVKSADKSKLISTMKDSVKMIEKSKSDDTNLKLVFGSKKSKAKTIYDKAKGALNNVILNIDTAISTDYNLDDPETFLGGWADYSSQHIHLDPDIVKVKDPKESKITIIHEASHLADPSVDDKGYYGTKGFEAMSEAKKITNAAHFEEIPRRKLGKSIYGSGYEFKPGKSKTGAPLTFEEKVKRQVSEYFRKAWDKASDIHMFLRDVRKEILLGSKTSFNAKKWRIMQISKIMKLTIHEQKKSNATITQLDVVLAEGVARGVGLIDTIASKISIPSPPAKSKAYYKKKIINDAIKKYNALLGNFKKDKKLVKYLVKQYRKPF